jgi:hypothetical protein
LFRTLIFLAVTGLIEYHNFIHEQWAALATNATCFGLGILVVSTWQKKERKPSDQILEVLFSSRTHANAAAAANSTKTDRAETPIAGSTN